MQQNSVARFDKLGFPQIQQDNCLLDIANTQGLVIVVQNQDFTVGLAVRTRCVNLSTEDEFTSLVYLWSPLNDNFLE